MVSNKVIRGKVPEGCGFVNDEKILDETIIRYKFYQGKLVKKYFNKRLIDRYNPEDSPMLMYVTETGNGYPRIRVSRNSLDTVNNREMYTYNDDDEKAKELFMEFYRVKATETLVKAEEYIDKYNTVKNIVGDIPEQEFYQKSKVTREQKMKNKISKLLEDYSPDELLEEISKAKSKI